VKQVNSKSSTFTCWLKIIMGLQKSHTNFHEKAKFVNGWQYEQKVCLLHCLFCGFGEGNKSKWQQMHSFIIFAHDLLRSSETRASKHEAAMWKIVRINKTSAFAGVTEACVCQIQGSHCNDYKIFSSLGHDAVFGGSFVTPKWWCFRTRIHGIAFQ
jgi:hypothetical protein